MLVMNSLSNQQFCVSRCIGKKGEIRTQYRNRLARNTGSLVRNQALSNRADNVLSSGKNRLKNSSLVQLHEQEPRVPTVCSDSSCWQRLSDFGSYCTAAVLACAMLTQAFPAHAETLTGLPRTVDGDTFELAGTKIRFYGIDAPEGKQSCQNSKGTDYKCGELAAERLASKVGRQSVSCAVKNTDQYGRSVAVCSLPGGEDLNKWMVANGYAVAYREFSKDYIADEDAARKAKKGIWEGTFEEPAKWRRETKAMAVKEAPIHPKGCDIKGNINAKGDKIYHVPGGRFYEATNIDPGERWFCSEKEAENAGWRASKAG